MGNFRILSLDICQNKCKCLLTYELLDLREYVCMCGEPLLQLNFSMKDLHRCLLVFYSVLTEVTTFDFLMDFSVKLLLQHP